MFRASFLIFVILVVAASSLNLKHLHKAKKSTKGNDCPEDRPFPCKNSDKCIPLKWICDSNWDCNDGYDEDVEMCTAANRIPVEQMIKFLSKEKWMMNKLFPGKSIKDVAFALAVSPTLQDFREKLNLDPQSIKNIQKVIVAIGNSDKYTLEEMGMNPESWSDVSLLFAKLAATGFV